MRDDFAARSMTGCISPPARNVCPPAVCLSLGNAFMKRLLAFTLFVLLALGRPALAYGPDGHKIIGAIADRKLANTPTGARVSTLLDGYTLEEVSITADTIKQWDKPGIDDPKVQKYFSSHPKIAEQLREFWEANPPTTDDKSAVPSHHWFHYTDVPLVGETKYGDGKFGRSQWDIVHMMRYCIAVLQARESEENARKITKPIAVILLAHFVGDIHQPLHVGAQYFDAKGQPIDPEGGGENFPDEGGNSLRLKLRRDFVPRKKDPKLHAFWDGDAVLGNLPQFLDTMPKEERQAKMDAAAKELSARLTKEAPKNWRLPADLPVSDYPEAWANEILPLARQVHARLRYQNVTPKLDHEKMVGDGEVVEEPMKDGLSYSKWSARMVLRELQLAGWRLADLLEKVLQPNDGVPSRAPGETPRQTSSPSETVTVPPRSLALPRMTTPHRPRLPNDPRHRPPADWLLSNPSPSGYEPARSGDRRKSSPLAERDRACDMSRASTPLWQSRRLLARC